MRKGDKIMKNKIGIIGYGWVASENHRNSYKLSEDAQIVAVCDVNPEALEQAKKDFGLSDDCLFTDYKALIDSGKCDMVDICTPNSLHCEQAKYALNAGLAVSIEKPVGVNSKKYGRKRLAYIKSAAAFAKSIGVEDILIHAGFIANNPFSAEYKFMKKSLSSFAAYCKSIGVNVLLETGGESPVTLLRIIEDIGTGNLYANLDTANLIMYGFGNPVDAVHTLNKHIKSMHIKDGVPPTTPNVLGKETPVGEGFVDFKRVFAELEKIGYGGPLIIEREIEGTQQLEDLKMAIQYLNTEIFGR